MSSFFAIPNNQNNKPTPSFSTSNTTAQPQQTQSTGSGILEGLGTSTQPQQQQQTVASSLFGGLGAAPQPQQQATFAGSAQDQVEPSHNNGQNNAYFDAILERSRKRAHADAMSDDLPQLQLGLGDLRQRIKRLGTGGQDRSVDGRAHYLLAASGVDPGVAVRDLNAFSSATSRVERAPPQDASDTDVEAYLANLQTQTTLSMISDGLARSVRDFDAFLEDNVSMEWDAQRRKIYEHFGIRPKETGSVGNAGFATSGTGTQGGFGRSRRSKVAAMKDPGTNGTARESSFGRSSLQKLVIGAAGPLGAGHKIMFPDVEKKMEATGIIATGPNDRFQRDKQSRYASKVQDLNIARLHKRPYRICHEFANVIQHTADQHGPDLIKAYRALIETVGEVQDITSASDPGVAKARQFAVDYLEDAPNSAKSKHIRSCILRGGARCLEKMAFEKMEELIAKNPRDANLGGIPNVVNKVKAYVRLQSVKKNLSQSGENMDLQTLGDDYVWVVVYFLLRTGHVREAADFVSTNTVAFRALDRSFASYIHAYAASSDRKLPGDLQARISSEYNQRLLIAPDNSIDPYRMACYKIIGRCDLRQRHLEIIKQDIEDFAWVQLVLAREINPVDEIASEVYGLAQVQDTIREIGNRFFAKGGAEIGSSFGAFVFLQIAVGMFEYAVSYLYTYSYVDGIHLAIALDYYGLLRVADPTAGAEDLLTLTTRGQPQISFGTMIGLYTRDFRAANVSAAVEYLTLICLNQDLPGALGRNQIDLCHEALRELVLESREIPLLLGDIRKDGTHIKGVIEERMQLIDLNEADEIMRRIIMQAANVADDNGRTTDAVLLYHLAGEFDNVIVIINHALSEAIAVPIGQDRLRLEPLKPRTIPAAENEQGTDLSLASVDKPSDLGNIIKGIYSKHNTFKDKIKPANFEDLDTLLTMNHIRELVETAAWVSALDVSFSLHASPASLLIETRLFDYSIYYPWVLMDNQV